MRKAAMKRYFLPAMAMLLAGTSLAGLAGAQSGDDPAKKILGMWRLVTTVQKKADGRAIAGLSMLPAFLPSWPLLLLPVIVAQESREVGSYLNLARGAAHKSTHDTAMAIAPWFWSSPPS